MGVVVCADGHEQGVVFPEKNAISSSVFFG
jgi:hypothetical protein